MMKNKLIKITYVTVFTFLMSMQSSFAAGMQYDMRVDGLACPFCAYGIEKKFTKTEGVKSVDVDLKNGLVIIKTEDGKAFKEDELKSIIDDAGFTMKSVKEKPVP